MTNEEAIKYLKQIYPNGGYTWLDGLRMEAIDMAIEALTHASVTKTSEQDSELEEEYQRFLKAEWFNASSSNHTMSEFCFSIARHFAQWQRQKDLKEGLESDALPAAYLDGVEKGKRWMREQMTAKAFPIEIDSSRSDGRCILSGNFARFETGDKVKVIIVKED